ncbi:hypothetical protein ARMGADRAFT_1080561 [Armillaria gallica]|uniref:Uncharacterized protein n=1 Tax=Armillaria gallica TaxID=47427 RepID=A0A2H3DB80_ARMGA|nr:hypothetical protein ARMGADRAFT_1080561 [Armillaria gallica]
MSPLNVSEADESFTDQLKKKAAQAMTTIRYTNEDFEKGRCLPVIAALTDSTLASASAPDGDDCTFVNMPHEHYDRWHHVQVSFPGGWTQCFKNMDILTDDLKHISRFPRPIKETGDKVYHISSSPEKG